MKFKIVTDSTANLETQYFKDNGVSVVTLYYLINGEIYPAYKADDSTLLQSFYKEINEKPKLSTSCANVEQYYDEFEKAVKEGLAVLYIGFSSGVSASFSNAELAREMIIKEFPNAEIYCADTHTGSFGQGFFVEQAVQLRNEGKGAREVYDYVVANRDKMNTYVTVDDLYYLYQGGRIPSLVYKIGSLIKIKPIIRVNEEGRLVSVGKVISRKQSLSHLAKIVEENVKHNTAVYIAHADCEQDASILAKKIEEICKDVEVKIGYLEAVIGSHTGVGGLALFFLSN